METLARTWRENLPFDWFHLLLSVRLILTPFRHFSFVHSTFNFFSFLHMASILALCVMGMHLQTIWGIAKQMHLSFMPFNPVTRIAESPWASSFNPTGNLLFTVEFGRQGGSFVYWAVLMGSNSMARCAFQPINANVGKFSSVIFRKC